MLKDLANLFEGIDLVWCDNPGKEIQNSENYKSLLALFPNLQDIHQKGLTNDKFEFNMTMRHIFRSLKVYHLLKQGQFSYKHLSSESLQKLLEKLEKFPLYLPLILVYHDIGRFIDRKTHTFQSAKLILDNQLLDDFNLSSKEKLLITKVIEYHLLLATIYTGESTFFGSMSLFNDEEFIKLLTAEDGNYGETFLEFLEIFTYLDVLGYPYAIIFDHYLKYYGEINQKLKNLLELWPDRNKILSRAKDYSLQWSDWRLSGALRIFQFVETKPHLTKEFYFTILRESIRPECESRGRDFSWKTITDFLSNIYKFQMKYAMGFLMLLAFGQLKRLRLKENQKILPKLLLFWILLSAEVDRRKKSNEEVVWNIYFDRLPFWSDMNKRFIEKLEIENIRTILRDANLVYNESRGEYNLHLNFRELLD